MDNLIHQYSRPLSYNFVNCFRSCRCVAEAGSATSKWSTDEEECLEESESDKGWKVSDSPII